MFTVYSGNSSRFRADVVVWQKEDPAHVSTPGRWTCLQICDVTEIHRAETGIIVDLREWEREEGRYPVTPTGCASAPRSAAAAQPGGQVLPGEFPLRDGTPALIWPLLHTDAEMLREGFRRLSSESRQHRFLEVLGELDDSMIRRLVDSVDGVEHIALVLIVLPPAGEEGPVGVAHLLQYPDDPATADIAVTVADNWQGRGIGTALVSALLERRPAAVTRLRTVVEADNRRSLALLAGVGSMSSGLPERGVLDVTVELAAATRPARTPAARPVTPIPPSIALAPPLTRLLRGYGRRVTDQAVQHSAAVPAIVRCLRGRIAGRRRARIAGPRSRR